MTRFKFSMKYFLWMRYNLFLYMWLLVKIHCSVCPPYCVSFLYLWANHLFYLQDGIEECRKLCGGHGYLCSSGLPELFAVYVPDCTYEGDNTILLLQVCELFRSHLSLANCMPPLLEFPIIYVLLVLPPLPTLIVCCKISLLNYNQRRICNK